MFDDPRITAVGLLVEAHAGLSARFAAQFEEHGLSAVEFEVLIRLARSPGNQLRMTDLAAQTSLSTSGVTRVVDRMERDGLLCRRACPTDRRSSYAVVTDAGLRRLDETLPGHLRDDRAVVHRSARPGGPKPWTVRSPRPVHRTPLAPRGESGARTRADAPGSARRTIERQSTAAKVISAPGRRRRLDPAVRPPGRGR